nr:hypothetical protein [Tanacetum cinerariifolium]
PPQSVTTDPRHVSGFYDTSGYVYERIVRVTVVMAHGIVGGIIIMDSFHDLTPIDPSSKCRLKLRVLHRVMCPLSLKQTQKPQNNRGMPKARHSVSSSFAHHYGSSSRHGNDDEDDDAFHASTLSPTTYLNSLSPLISKKYNISTSSQQDDDLLFERQPTFVKPT